MAAVPAFQQLHQQAVDAGLPVKRLPGEEIPPADVLRHALLKPDAGFPGAGIVEIREQRNVVGQLVTQDGQQAVVVYGCLIIGADLRRRFPLQAVQLRQPDIPPDVRIRTEHHPVLVGIGGDGNIAEKLRGSLPAGPDHGPGKLLHSVFLFQKMNICVQTGQETPGGGLICIQLPLARHRVKRTHCYPGLRWRRSSWKMKLRRADSWRERRLTNWQP